MKLELSDELRERMKRVLGDFDKYTPFLEKTFANHDFRADFTEELGAIVTYRDLIERLSDDRNTHISKRDQASLENWQNTLEPMFAIFNKVLFGAANGMKEEDFCGYEGPEALDKDRHDIQEIIVAFRNKAEKISEILKEDKEKLQHQDGREK